MIVYQRIDAASGCIVDSAGLIAYITYFYYPVLSGLLPILVSSVFSLLAFRHVRRIVRRQMPVFRRRLDRQMTSMILIRVVFQTVLTLPYTIQRIYALLYATNRTDVVKTATVNLVGAVTISLLYTNIAVGRRTSVAAKVQSALLVFFLLVHHLLAALPSPS